MYVTDELCHRLLFSASIEDSYYLYDSSPSFPFSVKKFLSLSFGLRCLFPMFQKFKTLQDRKVRVTKGAWNGHVRSYK